MGTRGAYGFRLNGKDFITYKQYDSYPSGLGATILNFVAKTTVEQMKDAVARIVLIDESQPPTPEQIKELAPYTDLNVSERSTADWYCLTRELQGNLLPYIHGKVRCMTDYKDFLKDSLFCEYAYIINLDSGMLEFYEGGNKDCKAPGRYAKVAKKFQKQNQGYAGVALRDQVNLDIPKVKAWKQNVLSRWESLK